MSSDSGWSNIKIQQFFFTNNHNLTNNLSHIVKSCRISAGLLGIIWRKQHWEFKLTWWTRGSSVFSTECVRISKVLGSHFIWCFSTLMSPLNVVVPRLIVPKFSPLTRTAHDNFHQKLGDALKIFLSKRQTEIVDYFRHVTSPRRLLWNATPSQSWPIAMFCESSLRNLVCDFCGITILCKIHLYF